MTDTLDYNQIGLMLRDVVGIVEKHEEVINAHGGNFNIFDTLRCSHAEQTHSRVIATLLDRQGSHALGDVFLRHFLDQLKTIDLGNETSHWSTDEWTNIIEHCQDSRVATEVSAKNGRVDILLTLSISNDEHRYHSHRK